MAQRRYGPVQGAGVGVIELEGDKPIEPGALGWCGYAGILEKGQVGELIVCPTKQSFLKKCGSFVDGSLLPDACMDYFEQAAGAGGLLLVRITDGTEYPSSLPVYCQKETRTLLGYLFAKNGGSWGGKAQKRTGDLADAADLLETSMDTGLTLKVDELKGGYIQLEAVPNKQYKIIGNTAEGVVYVDSDQLMKTDWGSGPSLRYYLVVENNGKALSCEFRDGVENPATEFGMYIYVDGALAVYWENLSLDPASSRYWENIVNEDSRNDEVLVYPSFAGAIVPDVRPANRVGEIDDVTETVLTAIVHSFNPAIFGDGDGTLALGTLTNEMVTQQITIQFSSATEFTVTSNKFGDLGSGTVGSLFTPNNKWSPPFTLTAGATPWEALDIAIVEFFPFDQDMAGGYLYPNRATYPKIKFRIVSSAGDEITVASGSDMTAVAFAGSRFMVAFPEEFVGGYDGVSGIVDADYESKAFDTINSPFNQIRGKNLGLVKFACPGVVSTGVQKAGAAYAEAKNHQFRYEVPSSILTEVEVDDYVNTTLGRSDFAVVSFPTYGYVNDPQATEPGKLKLVSLVGMIHGREAKIANDWQGYHKAGAGLDAVLPKVLKLITGEMIINEEYLNPKGIGIIKKVKGRFVCWGDRTLWIDPNWKWKHQRELMSYYEQVLIESFDWIVFAINDPITEKPALSALKGFFIPEFNKRAIRGKTADEAAIIKLDSELNTDLVRAAGDMYAQIGLRLADTVERFIIKIGKQGLFESVG